MNMSQFHCAPRRIGRLALFPILVAFGQAPQDHPELCGRPGTSIRLPTGVTTASVPSEGHSELRIQGLASAIVFPGVMEEVQQVCPIPQSKMVVLGLANAALYNIDIVGLTDASLLDSFYGFSPIIAPNQRWLVRRKFYPAQSVSSEEYLLYDLTQDWAHNREPGVSRSDMDLVGKVIYPAVKGNEPFYNVNLPINETHTFRSASFYWAPDSRALAFADSVQGQLSLVLVSLDQSEIRASAYHISSSEACPAAQGTSSLMLSDTEVSLPVNGRREIRATFKTGGSPCHEILTLQSDEFTPAAPEIHAPPWGASRTPVEK